MTQQDQIELHLRQNGSITSIEAIQQYMCTRLAAKVCILRMEDRFTPDGLYIHNEWKSRGTGRGNHWVEYQLKAIPANGIIPPPLKR